MLNVMLVDDEELERRALSRIIHENFSVLRVVNETTNGQDAVDYALANPVDIIFMDIEMPVKNGLTAAREIREFDKNVQIIILTAYSEFEYARGAIEARVFTYLLKPIGTSELKDVLNSTIRAVQPGVRRPNDIQSLDNGLSVRQLHIIEQAKSIIRSNIQNDVTVDEVADLVQIHSDYLSRIFKRKEGVSFKEYLTSVKMERAKALLRTDMPIKEVCYEICYSDPSYFSRSFKKHTGMTASDYKEKEGF